jgi:hypothetical protein
MNPMRENTNVFFVSRKKNKPCDFGRHIFITPVVQDDLSLTG